MTLYFALAGSGDCYFCSAPRAALISAYDESLDQMYIVSTSGRHAINTMKSLSYSFLDECWKEGLQITKIH